MRTIAPSRRSSADDVAAARTTSGRISQYPRRPLSVVDPQAAVGSVGRTGDQDQLYVSQGAARLFEPVDGFHLGGQSTTRSRPRAGQAAGRQAARAAAGRAI